VRHGETIWNREKRVQGISNIGLSDFGITQAERLAKSLKNEKLAAIYSSPLKRAYQTAEAIGKFHPVTIEIEDNLQELDQGDFESLTFIELREKHASFLWEWIADPASVSIPNGECLNDLQCRAWHAFKKITQKEGNALIVSHSFTIMTILCKIKDIALNQFLQMRVDLASKTYVEIKDGKYSIVRFNDINHLKDISSI
jgi:broad specificity phosphatase PhoE